MKRNYGFTLVELLVVIAIISILAGIVIPNVPKYINKARAVRAFAEIKGIDLALTKMLTDAGRSDFKSGFFEDWPESADLVPPQSDPQEAVLGQADLYSTIFYILLRKGKYAQDDPEWPGNVSLNDEVLRRLGDTYMELGRDPWGSLYQFYAGPFAPAVPSDTYYVGGGGRILVPFRIYQYTSTVPGGVQADDFTLLGVADPDSDSINVDIGYPAPRKSTQFVWCWGKNRRPNQEYDPGYRGPAVDVGLDFMGGGDDINNWDGDSSWLAFYN